MSFECLAVVSFEYQKRISPRRRIGLFAQKQTRRGVPEQRSGRWTLATNTDAGNSTFFEINVKIISIAKCPDKETYARIVRNKHNFPETFMFLEKRRERLIATTRRDAIVLESLAFVAKFFHKNICRFDGSFVGTGNNKMRFDTHLLKTCTNTVHFFAPYFSQSSLRIRTEKLSIFSNTVADKIDGVHIPKIVEDYVQKLA